MTYQKDARVDAYIEALPGWQQEICQQVRDIVHEADSEVVETIKRRVQPYFVLDGNICALLAAKDHVNVFMYDDAQRASTRKESSPAATTTSPPAPWRSGTPRRSISQRSSRCSGRSSRGTAQP